jgi:nicotinamide-nucleotide amidase
MRAELIMVGTELLLGEIVDTNATFLARNLADLGIDVFHKSTVGDNLERGSGVLREALQRSDIVIMSGGLGPTDDDLTREMVSAVTKRELVLDEQVLAEIEAWFRQRLGHSTMPEHNRKQALFPFGSQVIPNPVGTAPGFCLESEGKTVIALPGVPHELRTMFSASVMPILDRRGPGQILVSRNLRFVGIGESNLEEILTDLLHNQTNPTLALYASEGTVRLRMAVKARSEEEARKLMEPVEREIRERTKDYLFGVDSETLQQVVAKCLLNKGLTLALAESCTGGLVGHLLTNVPGSSAFLNRGYIVYSNQAKMEDLGVSEETLKSFGAVSEQTALEMAEGARLKAKSDLGLAITGIAGPGGGTATKPVGLVYMSLASSGDTITQRHLWKGTRDQIKNRAALMALRLLWQATR